MSPKEHVIYGSAAALALYPWLGADSLFFWGASFAIDIDHYLDYVYHSRFTDFSLKKMFDYHRTLKRYWHHPGFLNIEVFHTVEFIGALYLFSLWMGWNAAKSVCIGFVFHAALDMVFLYRHNIFFARTSSFTEYLIRRRILVKQGLCPAGIYDEALSKMNPPGSEGPKASDR